VRRRSFSRSGVCHAGAGVKEMASASRLEMRTRPTLARYDAVRKIATPLIAAVSGRTLGEAASWPWLVA
jgi:enoyl-CoA hydratase/carnithine racemase